MTKLSLEKIELLKSKLKPEDVKLLDEIIAIPLEQLINDHKAACEFQDWQWEEALKNMITDYKKWVNKTIGKTTRKMYLDIIKGLEKELADVRCKSNIYRRRTMGYCIGRDKQEDGNTRNTDNLSSKTLPKPFRVEKKRIYHIGGKAE